MDGAEMPEGPGALCLSCLMSVSTSSMVIGGNWSSSPCMFEVWRGARSASLRAVWFSTLARLSEQKRWSSWSFRKTSLQTCRKACAFSAGVIMGCPLESITFVVFFLEKPANLLMEVKKVRVSGESWILSMISPQTLSWSV